MQLLLTDLLVFAFISSTFATISDTSQLKQAQLNHRIQLSTSEDLRYLSSISDSNHINKILDNILIPRVVGTKNHDKVFDYIVKELKKLKWSVEADEFVENAPIFGRLTFKNIIATLNPNADRYLVLACHYDSKYFKNDHFVGAIDSAVPCAMMLNIAKTMSNDLEELKQSDLSLKLIFFDGEEAFEEWGPQDSIYGAKHLAQTMFDTAVTTKAGENVNELNKMDMLILLDLIGHKNPSFQNYFGATSSYFDRLVEIEEQLHRLGLLKNHRRRYFQTAPPYGHIEDDHIPFYRKGVPILHLISAPFPPEWHTPHDNRSLVDMDTVLNVNLILKAFISEYLSLALTGSSTREYPPEKEL